MKLRVVGNSHVGALKRGLDQAIKEQPSHFDQIDVFPIVRAKLELEPFSRRSDNGVELIDDHARTNLRERMGVDRIEGDVWGVCMGLHNVVLLRDPFWDQHAPAWIARPEETPVSRALCTAIVEAGQHHVQAFLLHLKEAGIPTMVVAAPPLRRDHPSVANRRPEVPREVDRLAREALAGFAAEHDLPFVQYPDESLADDGFLREEFHSSIVRASGAPDLAHANQQYGTLMMRRVIDVAEQRFA